MKKRVVFAVLMIAFFLSFTISSAISETDIKSVKRILLVYLIDDIFKNANLSANLVILEAKIFVKRQLWLL